MKYTQKQMLQAMLERDSALDGRFYVGVLTTGIYCLPSCKAKNPKPENVKFFETREEAVALGLRGCRRCWSDKYPDTLPAWVKRLIVYLREHRQEKITESDLVKVTGVNITTVRRHFKERLGMTPLAFNRRQRLNHARSLIEKGSNYLSVAFECGYESASGFREAYIKQFGKTPGQTKEVSLDHLPGI